MGPFYHSSCLPCQNIPGFSKHCEQRAARDPESTCKVSLPRGLLAQSSPSFPSLGRQAPSCCYSGSCSVKVPQPSTCSAFQLFLCFHSWKCPHFPVIFPVHLKWLKQVLSSPSGCFIARSFQVIWSATWSVAHLPTFNFHLFYHTRAILEWFLHKGRAVG